MNTDVLRPESGIKYQKTIKQILQHLKSGQMELAEVPCPQVGKGQVLIQTKASLISAGTEKMLVEFSKANLIQKARQQPDKVKQVLDKMRTDGLMPTLEAVFRKLDQPLPLGDCNVGKILSIHGSRRKKAKNREIRTKVAENFLAYNEFIAYNDFVEFWPLLFKVK